MQTQTIDRSPEYNDVQEHDHTPGHACWCGFGVGSAGSTPFADMAAYRKPKTLHDHYERPEMFGKKVSPAIAEQRIVMLERENEILRDRVKGFEKLTATLSAKLDEVFADFNRLTGKTPQQVAAKTCGQANPLGNTLHGCILPDDHGGPCRTTEPLRAA